MEPASAVLDSQVVRRCGRTSLALVPVLISTVIAGCDAPSSLTQSVRFDPPLRTTVVPVYPVLHDIVTTSSELIAVGEGGAVLAWSSDGRTRRSLTRAGREHLFAAAVTTDGTIWAVGARGFIASSADGGTTWRQQTSGTDENLYAVVAGRDPQRLWVAGGAGVVLRTDDSGQSWHRVASGVAADLKSMAVSQSRIWVAGAGGVVLSIDARGNARTSTTLPAVDLNAVAVDQGGRVWVAGMGGSVSRSDDEGQTWKSSVVRPNYVLEGLAVSSDGSRVAVSSVLGDLWASSDAGATWRAASWQDERVPPRPAEVRRLSEVGAGRRPRAPQAVRLRGEDQVGFYAIRSDRDDKLWAVGRRGTVHRSDDWGRTWTYLEARAEDLWAMAYVAQERTLVALGRAATSATSTDGGLNWTARSVSLGGPSFGVFAAADSGHLWAVGDDGVVFVSEDAAKSWQELPPPTDRRLLGIVGTQDGKVLWAVGDEGTLVQSSDFGRTWLSRPSGTRSPLRSVYCAKTARLVLAVGDGGSLIRSADGGATWAAQPSATNAHLYSVSGTANGDRLWAAGTNGTIVTSADAGLSWHLQSSNITTDLWAIVATAEASHLWAAGQAGVLLHSTDGGLNWNALSTGTAANLWAISIEERHGRVWVSGEDGVLLRGELRSEGPAVSAVRIASVGSRSRLTADVVHCCQAGTSAGLVVSAATQQTMPVGYFATLGSVEVSRSGPAEIEVAPRDAGLRSGDDVWYRIDVSGLGFRHALLIGPVVYDRFAWFRSYRGYVLAGAAYALLLAAVGACFVGRPDWMWRVYFWSRRPQNAELPRFGEAIAAATGLASGALAFATLVPWLARRQRVLDAWVESSAPAALAQFEAEGETRAVGDYVPLPVEVHSMLGREVVDQPSARTFRVIAASECAIEVLGSGGAGKTTLAFALARWASERALADRLLDHRALPLLIDEDTEDLLNTVTARLRAITRCRVTDDFAKELISSGRLVLILDRLSERSEATRLHFSRGVSQLRARCLVWTTRRTIAVEGVQSVTMRPLPLSPEMVPVFALAVVAPERRNRTLPQQQIEVVSKVVELLARHGIQEVSPLLVRLYVLRAMSALDAHEGLDSLPSSIPDVYSDFVRHLIRPRDSDAQAVEECLMVAQAVAAACLQPDFIPKEVPWSEVAHTELAAVPTERIGDRLEQLVGSGLLVERASGRGRVVRFQQDPVAEWLGAIRICQLCGTQESEWKVLSHRLATEGSVSNFLEIITVCCHAYGDVAGWPWRSVLGERLMTLSGPADVN